ncbi:3-phosphoshikimate 1-carboxyvinyltransferase [Flavobacterium cyanobacteriorum]|uniref:3-phosphoshikimate 1-carboxyvinyltransferase n=1 Tax=Flavobacterium cyanobacteriorum TaxID=2022802 RepID=A0A255Z0U6_9FLAO|nr:3-phosphoshikimate 1-carboxyvinyltransferase [Flavobacterium cyanobacteriorum]OYQ35041.1 3-phosphoshikimate 1-carboxyvinyltransferase [Flavobacterium cyanobacteriorum]
MDVRVHLPGSIKNGHITITGSKSETNRLLLLSALYPNIIFENASVSDDSDVMHKALCGNNTVIDVQHAGTAMRFLTAFFASQEGREVVLTGSARMKQRPIAILVEALRLLGADIEYLENEGFPPLRIKGRKLTNNRLAVKAGVSSQYITALLLIAPKLENGLELTLDGQATSLPYIQMTLSLLNEVGIDAKFQDNTIIVPPKPEINNLKREIIIESDWSSASYYYSIVALSPEGTSVTLSSYKKNSLQGDSAIVNIYQQFGVETIFNNNNIRLTKARSPEPIAFHLDLNSTPDIAQTIAVTCFGLGIGCRLTGLHTLKIKETDRLSALKTELEKLGAEVSVTDDHISIQPHPGFQSRYQPCSPSLEGPGEVIATYSDHRMAMAFAPLAVKIPVIIQDAGVVSKSYPAFWEDMIRLGFLVDVQ